MTDSSKAVRPNKPHSDFPLFAHRNGSWAEKMKGKLVYFGPWRDPQTALNRWLDQKDDLLAGRTPRDGTGDLTLRELLNRFLTFKTSRVQTGELRLRSFKDYQATCDRIIRVLGKRQTHEDLNGDASSDCGRTSPSTEDQWPRPVR